MVRLTFGDSIVVESCHEANIEMLHDVLAMRFEGAPTDGQALGGMVFSLDAGHEFDYFAMTERGLSNGILALTPTGDLLLERVTLRRAVQAFVFTA